MKGLPTSAVVLCGGTSSRMGRDKASLPFGPESMLARVVRLAGMAVDEVVLAAGSHQAVPAGFNLLRDARERLGPLPALLGAATAVDAEYMFLVACDTPLLEPALVRLLLDRAKGRDACVPVVDRIPMTTCAVYRTSAVRAAGPLLPPAATSLRALLAGLNTLYLDETALRVADPQLLSFIPCNTPGEYRHALRLAGLSVNDSSPRAV